MAGKTEMIPLAQKQYPQEYPDHNSKSSFFFQFFLQQDMEIPYLDLYTVKYSEYAVKIDWLIS